MTTTENELSLPPAVPPVSPRPTAQPDETDQKQETELHFHKVVEPSLSTVNHRPLRRVASPNRATTPPMLYGHLYKLRNRPKAKNSNSLPAQHDYVQENIVDVPQRSSSQMSYNSTTRVKQLPLPYHSHTTTPFPRVGSARGVRSVPVCSERYLGTDRNSKMHMRSKSMEHLRNPRTFTDQVKRYEEEQRALHRTRSLKRTFEIYSHRTDQQYYMSGSGIGLTPRYHVDEAELHRLREFSKAKIAQRTASASSQRLSRRERLITPTIGVFVTQNQSLGSTSDMAINGQQLVDATHSDTEKALHTHSCSAITSRTDGDEQVAKGSDGDQDVTKGEKDAGKGDSGIETSSVNDNDDTGVIPGKTDDPSEGADKESKTSDAQNTSNEDASGAVDNDQQRTKNEDLGDQSNSNNVTGDCMEVVGNEAQGLQHDRNNSDADGEIEKDVDGRTVNKEAEGGQEGDMDDVYGDRDGSVKAGGDEESNLPGEEEHQDGEPTSGSQPALLLGPDVLQISLTSGIALVSKPSPVRNRADIFMTNFDDPESLEKGFKSEMEILRREKDLQSSTSDSDDEAGSGDNSKKYHMKIQDSKIAQMEENLERVKLLEEGISNVGRLKETREDLEELCKEEEDAKNVAAGEYEAGVFSQVKNDEEMEEADERRKKRRHQKLHQSTVREGSSDETKEAKKPYRFQLTDIYNFINSRQREIFEQKFEELDIDGNGQVTLKELTKQLKESNVPESEIKKFMQVFDLNNDKTIDRREFVTVAALNDKLTGHVTRSEREPLRLDLDTLSFNITAYKEMFEVTDKNGDGRLNVEEIMLIIALSVGVDIGSDREVVEHVHKTIDSNSDGSIDFVEFLSYIPFFLRLHHQILGKPASIRKIEAARLAVKKAVIKAGVR